MTTKTALIAGALGVVGRALVEHLTGLGDWNVVGLARRHPRVGELAGARFIQIDLTDRDACRAELSGLGEVTHVFFTAYTPRPSLADEVTPNLAMLVNLVETVEPIASELRHVQLMQGSKWYGNHLGPYKTPAKEDDPRLPAPHFYYAQQDWLVDRQRAKSWTWSALRPHAVCGFALGGNLNLLGVLALYASITKQLGLPLRFPGKPGAFTAIYQMTDAALLARAMLWAATSAQCANQAFNVTNGDFIRWCNVWPAIARFFEMEVGPVQPFELAQIMADKEPLWSQIRARYGLCDYSLAELVNWGFGDFVFTSDFDIMSSMTKIRQYGWTEVLDTETMLIRSFKRLRADRIIP